MDLDQLSIAHPERGFVCGSPASRWEDGTAVGNGAQGALSFGHPYDEEIVLSHESLFLPIYPAGKFIRLAPHLDRVRELVMENRGGEAMEVTMDLARREGFPERTLTDPFIGACSLHITRAASEWTAYARSVDFETGDSVTAWADERGTFHRRVLAARGAGVVAVQLSSPDGSQIDASLELSRIERDLDPDFYARAVERETREATERDLRFAIRFAEFSSDQSLVGCCVAAQVELQGGEAQAHDNSLHITGANRVLILLDVQPEFRGAPVSAEGLLARLRDLPADYDQLLLEHAEVHSEMFRRTSFSLCAQSEEHVETGTLRRSSRVGDTVPALVQKAFDAGRYAVISSTGTLPPALQGIWTGTWRPNWSGDFTLNGNLQSAVAASLPGNHHESLRAALTYLSGLMDDFRVCARELFGFRGIWVPWRSSTHGQCHYAGWKNGHDAFPGTYWFAGTAWWARFYYDYWLYTGDEDFFREQLTPFLLEAAAFYEDYLTVERDGTYVLVPSYSPENDPPDGHSLQPNATMTIAAIRQLLRTLLAIGDKLGAEESRQRVWRQMLAKMPGYTIDASGALSEWAWTGIRNNENHRHASHLYPLFDEVAPEIAESPELQAACRVAIEERLKYRRARNGAEMSFGLVQLGMAAAYLRDLEHAYECVEWLTASYWSPAMVSQHDPGDILNTDISGGLPALIITMLVQSFAPAATGELWRLAILPCLPVAWPNGSIDGVRCRGGFEVSVSWAHHSVTHLEVTSLRGERCTVELNGEHVVPEFVGGRWVHSGLPSSELSSH